MSFVLSACFAVYLAAQPAVPPGVPVLGGDPMAALGLLGDAQYGKVERVTANGPGFTSAIRCETTKRPPNDWNFQLGALTTSAVTEGDVVNVSFWARSTKGQPETGEGRAIAAFATGGPEWSRSFSQAMSFGREWTKFDLPFKVLYSRPAGESLFAFSLGFGPQVVEFANFSITNHGKAAPLTSFPRTRLSYKGEEPDAPWRRAALARIEKLRKGNLSLLVVDAKGKPVPNAKVTFAQHSHRFRWGTAVAADRLLKSDPDSLLYKETLLKYFNQAAVENHLKWPFWEEWGRLEGLKALRWLKEQKLNVRAHNIIWPGYGNLPKDIPDYAMQPALLRRRIAGRIADATTATKGLVDDWDVANETFSNNDILKILGEGELGKWFVLAKKGDPASTLTLNDYPALDSAGLTNDPHLQYFHKTIARLIKEKAPLEAIGFQCHFGSSVVPPERALKALDEFGKFGKPIYITEFDLDTVDRDLQARYMRDFLIVCFSHPSVECVTQWGFWEGQHWMPNAALWDKNWNLLPHGKAYLDLVFRDWWTKGETKSDSKGRAAFRGFFGEYQIIVESGKMRRSLQISLSPGQAPLRVAI